MKIETKYFGEINVDDNKIIHFEEGLFGFEQYKDYTVLYDLDKGEESFFSWLQCTTEKGLAFPIVNPQKVMKDYNPTVEDGLIEKLGEFAGDEDMMVYVLATVPQEVEKTSVNLKAPLVINIGTKKGVQIVAENNEYPIKYFLIQDKEGEKC